MKDMGRVAGWLTLIALNINILPILAIDRFNRDTRSHSYALISETPKFLRDLFGIKEETATPSATNSTPANYRNITQTELAGFFSRNPPPGGGRTALWPRVVLTVVEAPPWHLQNTSSDGRRNPWPGIGCWKFKAKIWESQTESRDIEPFYFCNGKDKLDYSRLDDANLGIRYHIWSGYGQEFTSHAGTTGITRTDGPTPPDTPLPIGVIYRRTAFHYSFTGKVIENIIYDMQVDYLNDPFRLWVNLAPSLQPT